MVRLLSTFVVYVAVVATLFVSASCCRAQEPKTGDPASKKTDDVSPHKNEAAIAKLIEELGSKRFAVRRDALKQLRSRGKEAVPALLRADQESKDVEVKEQSGKLVQQLLWPKDAITAKKRLGPAAVSLDTVDLAMQPLRRTHLVSMRKTADTYLKGLPNLTFNFGLDLSNTRMTDAKLKEPSNLRSQTILNLSEPYATDEGMKALKELKTRRFMSRKGTKVSHGGLKVLHKHKNLKVLNLGNTKNASWPAKLPESRVTAPGIAVLQRALPTCRIFGPTTARANTGEERKQAERKVLDPTPEQLAAAKEAYGKHAAVYEASTDPAMKLYLTTHIFYMPGRTTDADLKGLPDLPFYFGLSLPGSNVTDAGLKELKNLKNLTVLNLSKTKVTDAGMVELKELKNLRYLLLKYTKVKDGGLRELKELKNLKLLVLGNAKNSFPPPNFAETPVTNAGVEELQRALPHCHIAR